MQCRAILLKNLYRTLTNKKKIMGEFTFPIVISALYLFAQSMKVDNPMLYIIFSFLLKIYIAMIGMSATRELVTLFMHERTEKHRQYQMIYSLSSLTHTMSNLLYMGLFMSITILPFFIALNYQ